MDLLLLLFDLVIFAALVKRSDWLNDGPILALDDLVIDMVLVIGVLVLPQLQEDGVKASAPLLLLRAQADIFRLLRGDRGRI